jgi:hypothetical protein
MTSKAKCHHSKFNVIISIIPSKSTQSFVMLSVIVILSVVMLSVILYLVLLY